MNNLDKLEKKLRKQINDFDIKYSTAKIRLEFAIQIVHEREKAGLSQKDLALKLKTTQSVISRIENGKDMLQKIANALGKKSVHVSFV